MCREAGCRCGGASAFRRLEETFTARTAKDTRKAGTTTTALWSTSSRSGSSSPKPSPSPGGSNTQTKAQACRACWNNFLKTNLYPGVQQLITEHQNCLQGANANPEDPPCLKEAKVNDCIMIHNGKLNGLRLDCKVWASLCSAQYGPCALNGRCPQGTLPPRLPLIQTPQCVDD